MTWWTVLLTVRRQARAVRNLSEGSSPLLLRSLVVQSIQLPGHVIWQPAAIDGISSRRSACTSLRIWAAALLVLAQLERRNLRLLRVCFFALASGAHKMEALFLRLLGREAMALAMLPDVAPLARDAMGTVVQIFAVQTAYRAIEVPDVVFLGQLLELLLVLFFLCLELSL